MVFGKLAEFDEDPAGGFGVNKSDFCVVSARSGFLIDQRRSLLKIGFHLCLDIIDLKTDVMDPLAFGLQKLYERRIQFCRLDQFNIGLPNLKKSNLRFLCGHHLNP